MVRKVQMWVLVLVQGGKDGKVRSVLAELWALLIPFWRASFWTWHEGQFLNEIKMSVIGLSGLRALSRN